jgi:YhcH/YjgK/YiaL family protein
MIIDTLTAANRYTALHPGFAAAFAFVPQAGALMDGRYPIDGDRIYALVSRADGRGKDHSPLEAHRRYIDIQMVLAGHDLVGWKPCAGLSVAVAYDQEKDIEFYQAVPDFWHPLMAGMFAVYFPADAHAPLAGSGQLRKLVIKVAVP